MSRVFTMRKVCRACGTWFLITSAASKFCKDRECVKRRRKADRVERKERMLKTAQSGSATHLARALKTGD